MSMGVYINMEMPTSCFDCPFMYGRRYCRANNKIEFNDPDYSELKGRYDGCPIVPVSVHGDLIDRDALEQDAQKRLLECEKYDNQFQKPYEVMRAIVLAPTIIPAESEGEA